MAGWSAVTATYFAFQDDVLARMIARQAEMQFAYEDRIADMRAQVDRVTSRQLLDQEQLEQKLDQIVRRQSLLEQRATTMGTVADPAATGSLRPPRAAGQPAAGTPKPSPISGPALFGAPAARRARPRTAAPRPADSPWPGFRRRPAGNVETVLARAPGIARPGRRPPGQHARLARRELRIQVAADARRARRCRPRRRQASQCGNRRPVRLLPPVAQCRPVRKTGLSHQCGARPGRAPDLDGRRGAAAQAGRRRDRDLIELRRADRSVPRAAGDAHRLRLPRRHRRSDPCHRRRHRASPPAGAAAMAA